MTRRYSSGVSKRGAATNIILFENRNPRSTFYQKVRDVYPDHSGADDNVVFFFGHWDLFW